MSFAVRHRDDRIAPQQPLAGLFVRQETDAQVMAALQGRTLDEMTARLAAGHRAYVASLDDEDAAWGWVATRTATIGELGATFAIPDGERYLWNFVTRPAFRGRGIYPRLVDAIVAHESGEARRFWIAWAPENHASASGIRKSGFRAVAELSFDVEGRAAVRGTDAELGDAAARVIGLPVAEAPLTPCWKCIRAGKSADRACRAGQCCCDYQAPARDCATPALT